MTSPIQYDREQKTFTITQNTGITFSLALLLMISGAVISATTWVTTTQSRMDNVIASVKENQEEINKLKATDTTNQIKFTEIQTELKNIVLGQDELKVLIKEMKR